MENASSKDTHCGTCENIPMRGNASIRNPDHSASMKRLNRVRGQLEAVSRMIQDQEYCPSIIQQIRAATSALRGLEAEILRGHLRGCVKTAFESKDPFAMNDKIEEIIGLWNK